MGNIGNLGGKEEIGKTMDIGKMVILGIIWKLVKLPNAWGEKR